MGGRREQPLSCPALQQGGRRRLQLLTRLRRRSRSLAPEALLARASTAKEEGDLRRAETILRRVAGGALQKGPAASIAIGVEARVATYELALLLSQQGRHADADQALASLGFSHKLSPSLLDGSAAGLAKGAGGVVAAFDNVLPQGLFQGLCKAFAPTSPFWAEHNYPTPGFFSYNQSVVDLGATSKTSLIQATVEQLRPLAEKVFPALLRAGSNGGARRIASVEWWAHRRDAVGGGHQLHFDLDEAGLAALPPDAMPPHPLISCVLYLSGEPPTVTPCKQHAPTLVTDQSIASGSAATRAWLCTPALNRLLMFDGGMLHGVVPPLPSSSSDRLAPRVTLMLGLWGDAPKPTLTSYKARGPFGPNMPMPAAIAGLQWPKLLQCNTCSDSARVTKAQAAQLKGPISPVWIPLATPARGLQNGVDVEEKLAPKRRRTKLRAKVVESVEFFGRWFLNHEPAALQSLVLAEARQGALLSAIAVTSSAGPSKVEEVSMEELLRLREASAGASSGVPGRSKKRGREGKDSRGVETAPPSDSVSSKKTKPASKPEPSAISVGPLGVEEVDMEVFRRMRALTANRSVASDAPKKRKVVSDK